jgi:hypothetical protein
VRAEGYTVWDRGVHGVGPRGTRCGAEGYTVWDRGVHGARRSSRPCVPAGPPRGPASRFRDHAAEGEGTARNRRCLRPSDSLSRSQPSPRGAQLIRVAVHRFVRVISAAKSDDCVADLRSARFTRHKTGAIPRYGADHVVGDENIAPDGAMFEEPRRHYSAAENSCAQFVPEDVPIRSHDFTVVYGGRTAIQLACPPLWRRVSGTSVRCPAPAARGRTGRPVGQ